MTELLTKEKLDEYEALAKAAQSATNKPWDAEPGYPSTTGGQCALGRVHVLTDPDQEEEAAGADAEFIAALSPEVALSLIAAARELEQMRQQVCVLVREDMLELPAGYGGVHDPEFSDAAAIAGFRALAEESGWGPTNGR